MNDYEIERIAAAVNVLRPDWPVRSLVTLMNRAELIHKPRRDVMVAFAWIASEPNTSNPGRVLEAGPWWKAAAIETPSSSFRYPPKGADECPRHVGEWVDACRICNAPKVVDEEPEDRTARRTERTSNYAEHVQTLRALARKEDAHG